MKKLKNKIVSGITLLAVGVTAAFGSLSFAGCSSAFNEYISNGGETEINELLNGATTYAISSADTGSRTVTSSGVYYYLSPDGTGDGSSVSNPAGMSAVDTLLGSEGTAEAGDTIVFLDGTYNFTAPVNIWTDGNYDAPITITAKNAGKVTFSFYGEALAKRGVQIYASYTTFYGINVCGSGDNGLYLSGNYNLVEYCEFYDNRDTGLQIGRNIASNNTVDKWPSYNLVKNCTSHNNYDYQGYGEDADGFAAKLTLGYGNVFDGCIAYRNSDDGWDLYAKSDSGNLGQVLIYNCVAFENGYLEYTQAENTQRFVDAGTYDGTTYAESNTNSYHTASGDGNGFKLGGEAMEGDVFVYNCLSFNNAMHGFTDNSNPGYLSLKYCTAVDNGADIDDDSTSSTFGQVINKTSSASHANFDISRQTYSYNHIDHCLSIKTTDMGGGLVYDKVRGSANNSIIFGNSESSSYNYKITDSIDADTKNGIGGTSMEVLLDADVFTQVAVEVNETTEGEGEEAVTTSTYTYNISGLKTAGSVHSTYRNSDGSINMGNLYAVADQSVLLGADNPIGATLNKTSYDEYTHYAMTDFSEFTSANAVRLQAAADMVYVQTDADAVYQDFEAVSQIYNCMVVWTSSDESILKVEKTYNYNSISKVEYVPITVTRPDSDTEVTLTATISYYGQSVTKEFVLNVVADNPAIGDITVVDQDGNEITEGDSIIVDKYTILQEPEIIVLNANDYSGKTITTAEADFETTYEFAEDIAALSSGEGIEVAGFTTAQDGAFKITMTVTLTKGENKGDEVSFYYYVIVASNTANVYFLNNEYTVTVNSTGYNISGDLTNAIGTIYSYASSTAVADITAEYIMTNGTSNTFRATRISYDYANANLGGYFIYTVFTNGNGQVTSDIYTTEVKMVEISTTTDFYNLAQGITTTDSITVYALTTDLDFTDYSYTMYWELSTDTEGFKGFFNGNGHTIKNVTIDDSTGGGIVGVFRVLQGGTITNTKFENISVTGYGEQIGGIIGRIKSGTVSYLQINNVTVLAGKSTARIGGLAGQVVSDGTPTYISHISIVNDVSANEDGSYTYQIGGANATERVAALIGFAQTSGAAYNMEIYIDNCYVQAIVYGPDYVGGIIGRYDDRNALDTLTISNCYSNCIMVGEKRSAGILGGGSAKGTLLTVTGCVFTGKLVSTSWVEYTAYTSGYVCPVVGSFSASVCSYSNNAAYFTDRLYSTTILTADSVKLEATWTALGYDLTVWTLDTTNGGLTLTVIA